MCGIVGYVGSQQAAPILLDGLSKLEYRGYDSAGLAVRNGTEETEVIKAKGRLKVLFEKTNGGAAVPGTCGIGHTRWATHGEPSENNAHPHMSDDGNVVAVHNGIIENYQELKNKLLRKGYTFYSETDTEVAVKLIDYYYKKYEGTPVDAINHAMIRIRGSYALAVMFREYPNEIYVARKDSPMILATANGESYIASDVPAILKYARNVYYIGNLEIGRVKAGEITFYNLDGDEIEKESKEIKWDAQSAEKAGFEHYEISNFSLPGLYSRHNSSYWTEKKYLGCGPSAHSYNGVSRQWNVASLDTYIKGISAGTPVFEIEELDLYTRYNDFVITRIRTEWGMPLSKLRDEFGEKLYDYCLRMAAPHLKQGTLELVNDILKLTRKGIFISDGIMSDMLWTD